MKLQTIVFSLFMAGTTLLANRNDSLSKIIKSTPPRIIRSCCAFGSELPLAGIPFAKITHITSIDQLGEHAYLGDKSEGNGLIYTKHGGFIDMGHLRDIADWTYFLYATIMENKASDTLFRKLGYEGGSKNLRLAADAELDRSDCIVLAGKIAYDLSIWHEISTWFGASTIPMIPERYSSFSIEDAYSNLLGVYIAMDALQSDEPFNLAMTKSIYNRLIELGAVKTEKDTYDALAAVQDIWWTREKRLPNSNVILKRNTEVDNIIEPWLVPDLRYGKPSPEILIVPQTSSNGQLLTKYYEFSIDLNYKFPVKEMFPARSTSRINQNDFAVMLHKINSDLQLPDHNNISRQEQKETKHTKRVSNQQNL